MGLILILSPDFINLQFILETITKTPLDKLIQDRLTRPLGMSNTWFNRGNRALSGPQLNKIAATEFQIQVLGNTEPQRAQPVWGTVGLIRYCWVLAAEDSDKQTHDETAWSLNGVAGSAGLFSTANDLSIFCQASAHFPTIDKCNPNPLNIFLTLDDIEQWHIQRNPDSSTPKRRSHLPQLQHEFHPKRTRDWL